MTGFVAPDRVPALLARAALFAHTSPAEGFPNTLLEAWALGVPSVSAVDPDGAVATGGVGLLAGNEGAFVAAVRELMADAAKRRALGTCARAWVFAHTRPARSRTRSRPRSGSRPERHADVRHRRHLPLRQRARGRSLLLAAMTDALTHRGPDDSGLYVSGPVGLGQRRLSIVDLSAAGRNPMPNEDETLWITFNGEVYNVRERRAEFEARGHRFRSHTDTEMLLHLYEEKGASLVDDLRGMFAFALWDAPHKTLVVVRDRLGIKPLYWRAQGGTFAFGSELKALLADPECPREVDPAVVPAYLTLGYVPSPSSILAGVHKLEPGHLLVVSPRGPEVRRWWTPPIAETAVLPVEEATRQLRALLEESARLRFMSDVPFGAFLSGGIDSSIVCALMARLMDRPVATFTIGFAGAPEDERVHARAVAQHIGAEHHEFVVEPDALSILPRLAWHLDEPLADASALPTWAVSEIARRHVTVALSGDGGDETWGGYETYRLAHAYAAFDALPGGARGLLGAIGRSGLVPDGLARRLGRASLDPVERHLALMALGSGTTSRACSHRHPRGHAGRRARAPAPRPCAMPGPTCARSGTSTSSRT